MNRRELIAGLGAGALAAGAPAADPAVAAPGARAAGAKRIRWAQGWLLWRDDAEQTLRQAIEDLHAVGADGIEYSPREGEPEAHGFSRGELLAFLADRNMAISGMYFSVGGSDPGRRDAILAAARARIALVKAYGARNLVIGPPEPPRLPADRRAALDRLGPLLNEIGRLAREEGVEAGLHPHLNTLVETAEETDLAMKTTDPRLVRLSADTGHIHLAGGDVLAVLRRHRGRLNYFHFKDGVRPFVRPHFARNLRELGRGEVPFPAIMKLLREIRFEGWINVEQDRSELPPHEASRLSMAYVKRALRPIYG
jgi:inosose dehydratase